MNSKTPQIVAIKLQQETLVYLILHS